MPAYLKTMVKVGGRKSNDNLNLFSILNLHSLKIQLSNCGTIHSAVLIVDFIMYSLKRSLQTYFLIFASISHFKNLFCVPSFLSIFPFPYLQCISESTNPVSCSKWPNLGLTWQKIKMPSHSSLSCSTFKQLIALIVLLE